jgi:methyl-accepting chemotaxis protein
MFKSVRAKLLSVFGLGAVVFGVVLVQSVWNSSEMRTHLRGLYAHQVAPMEDLKEIVDAYAVDVVDATHKLRSGQFDWSGAEASINSAMSLIHERWSAYVAGDRSVEERTLIDSAAPLMAEADAGVADLLGFIAAQDMASVERFAVERLYQTIDPISGVVSELVAAKVGGVRALVAELEAHAGTAIVTGLVAAVIVLGIVAFGVFVVRNRIPAPRTRRPPRGESRRPWRRCRPR